MICSIVEKPAFTVVEKASVHTTEKGENTKSVPAFWDKVYADGTVKTLSALASDLTYMYGICYDNPNRGEKTFEYSIAVESESDAPEGYRKKTIPARTWAVFPCKGAAARSISDTWEKIFDFF